MLLNQLLCLNCLLDILPIQVGVVKLALIDIHLPLEFIFLLLQDVLLLLDFKGVVDISEF